MLPRGSLRSSLIVVLAVSVLFSIGIAGSWQNPGLRMDEGGLLEYPTLVQQGKIPFRDFQSSYGPGTYLPLVAAYSVFGPSVTVERAVGTAYRVAVVLAIVSLMSPLGAALMGASGCLAVVGILGPGPPVAFGWYAALACALWAIWLARSALSTPSTRQRSKWTGAGLLLGSAISIRPDLGVVGMLAVLLVAAGGKRAARGFFACGLGLGLVPLGFTVAATGLPAFWTVWVQARLRVQSQGGLPFSPSAVAILSSLAIGALFVLVTAVRELRRGGATPMSRCWLGLSILSFGLFPQAFQRADAYHFADVAPLVLGLLPWAATCGRKPAWVIRTMIPIIAVLAVGLHAAAAIRDGSGYAVSNDGRAFAVATRSDQQQLQAVVHYVDLHTSPGERIFVGTQDLRLTLFADTWIYYLAPTLRPASFYLQLEPGDTDRPGSRLSSDLQRADVLILDSVSLATRREFYPNSSPGPDAPNKIVARDFSIRFRAGPYSVWLARKAGGTT